MSDISNRIQLIGGRALVRLIKNEETTASGIYLHGEKDKTTNMGVVVAVGPGAILESGVVCEMAVHPGDKVIFPAYVGSPIKVKEEDQDSYVVIIERDIMCVVKDE